MQPTLKKLAILCSSALLLACAHGVKNSAALAPLARLGNADAAYVTGRDHHQALRLDQAGVSYRAALQADPQHVNARNGLATLHAQRGEFGEAIALWQALTHSSAARSAPDNSFLFSNLGYAYFLSGQYTEAIAALEQACLLDPLNERAWRHMGGALEKVGQHARAQQMFQQADTLRRHDFKADYKVAARNGVAAIDSAVLAASTRRDAWDETQLIQNANGVYELRRVRVAAVAVPAALAQTGILLEIRNGNGVTGMARSLAGRMGDSNVRVVRLSNQKGYGVLQTRVEYQPHFRAAAERLAGRFGATNVVEVRKVGRADVRLVIGRDLIRPEGTALSLTAPVKAPAKAG